MSTCFASFWNVDITWSTRKQKALRRKMTLKDVRSSQDDEAFSSVARTNCSTQITVGDSLILLDHIDTSDVRKTAEEKVASVPEETWRTSLSSCSAWRRTPSTLWPATQPLWKWNTHSWASKWDIHEQTKAGPLMGDAGTPGIKYLRWRHFSWGGGATSFLFLTTHTSCAQPPSPPSATWGEKGTGKELLVQQEREAEIKKKAWEIYEVKLSLALSHHTIPGRTLILPSDFCVSVIHTLFYPFQA